MGLQQQLDAFKAEFARTAPAGRSALYKARIEDLRASFALDHAAGIGDLRHRPGRPRGACRHRGGLSPGAILDALRALRAG